MDAETDLTGFPAGAGEFPKATDPEIDASGAGKGVDVVIVAWLIAPLPC